MHNSKFSVFWDINFAYSAFLLCYIYMYLWTNKECLIITIHIKTSFKWPRNFYCAIDIIVLLLHLLIRGVLSGKVGTGMCGPVRVLFSTSQVYQWPLFYLKIGLDIGHVFAKCLIYDKFFLWFTYWWSKHTLCIPIYMVKSTDLFKKKRPFKKKMI